MGLQDMEVSIAIGSSQSNEMIMNEDVLVGIVSTGSSVSATTLTFVVSIDGATYYPLYGSDSNEVSLTITTAVRAYALDPSNFYPWNFAKIREGTSASPVNQATNIANFQAVYRDI